MRRLRFTLEAGLDIAAVLATGVEEFGESAAARYEDLLATAFEQLAQKPVQPAAARRSFTPPNVLFYHLRHVSARLEASRRIGRARHFVVYSFDAEEVLVLRVLHDAMDLPAQFD